MQFPSSWNDCRRQFNRRHHAVINDTSTQSTKRNKFAISFGRPGPTKAPASGGFAPWPLDQVLCHWTPLGALPDPRYMLAFRWHPLTSTDVCMYVCMYVCMVIYIRAKAYSLDCHVGAMINRRLYRTFQSLVVHRTAAVTSTGRELSVAMSNFMEIVPGNPSVERFKRKRGSQI